MMWDSFGLLFSDFGSHDGSVLVKLFRITADDLPLQVFSQLNAELRLPHSCSTNNEHSQHVLIIKEIA